MKFKKFNNNPTGKKHSDCVIRAISMALDKTWDEVYDDLVVIGRELKAMPNSKECYEIYLKKYELITPKVVKGKKRLTANKMGNGTYILSQANHLSVMKNSVLLDTWDCRKRCVYKYWEIKPEITPEDIEAMKEDKLACQRMDALDQIEEGRNTR